MLKLSVKNVFLAIFFLSVIANAQTANWTTMSAQNFPSNFSGQINGITRTAQIKFHPTDPLKMYAVSPRGGLYISGNGGTTWNIAPGTDLLPNMRLASVCIDHTNDQIIYLGTGDPNYYFNGSGVYKSSNGGITFSATALTSKLVVELLMDPNDHNVIIAATNAGIYKTINAGSTWTLKSANVAFYDMKFKRSGSARTIYAVTISAFYRSTDFGETWSVISSGLYIPSGYSTGGGCRIAITPQDTNLVYFAMVAKNATVFKSTNGATSFTNVKDSLMPNLTGYENVSSSVGQGDYNFAIGIDPSNSNTFYLVAQNVWKSTNGGGAWTQMTNWFEKVHSDMHQVIVNPYDNSQLWNINDGGIWLSTDGGNNWTPKCDGLYGYEIYHGNCSPTRKDMLSIGTQDNGELYFAGNNWHTNRGGDWASKVAFDYSPNSTTAYYYSTGKRRNVIAGTESNYNLPFASLQDIGFYRGQPDLAFAANADVYRTNNLSAGNPIWTKITTINKTIMAVYVSPADSNRLYIIANDQTLYVSTNALLATPTFTQYTLPFGTNIGASITAIKNSPNILYAVFNTRVYRSIDNGATWTNISANLPSVNYVKIISDEYFSSNELIFVAGNNAVYYKKSGQSTWTLFATKLPLRTTISDLSVYDDGSNNSMLRIAEYGRGEWETAFGNLRPLSASFSSDLTSPCVGQNVQFYDYSTGSPVTWSWSFPGGSPSTSTAQNPVVAYNSAGTYAVTLVVNDGTNTSSFTRTSYISTSGQVLPFNEGFESQTFPPVHWINIDGGSDSKVWQRTTVASGYGNSNACMYFDNFNTNTQGNHDEIQLPIYDLYTYNKAKLFFDVAYQPYSLTSHIDSLQVLVSTNCGINYTTVYTKSGNTLSTVSGVYTSNFIPAAPQWRRDSVDLTSFTGLNGVIVKYRNIGNYGNNIYIDNVNIDGAVNYNSSSYSVITACDSFLWNGIMHDTSGIFTTTGLTNAAGYDSTATVELTINHNASSTTFLNACDSITWNGVEIFLSGIYTTTGFMTESGCDSAATLVLTINSTTSNTIVISCNSYTWNGVTYTTTGNYSAGPFTNSAGCDSIAYLNLTIRHSSSSNNLITACDSLNWNGVTHYTSGTYTTTGFTNAAGCDSSATVILTISNSTTSTATVTADDSYTWNGITYTLSGTYISAGHTNVSGCDSTATLVLTINSITLNLSVWLQGYYSSGSMRPAIMNEASGTDSTVVDSILVELHDSVSPFATVYSVNTVLHTNSIAKAVFPSAAFNGSYYIVIKHRNSIETWSKSTLFFNNRTMSFSF